MHALQILFARPEIERLGWVLLHFVWQGAVIAALCAIAFVTLRRGSASVRYLIACTGLLVMAACLPATWFVVAGAAPGGTGKQSLPVRTGGGEAAETRGRVSPRLDLRVSERRDYAPDHTFDKSHSEFAGNQPSPTPSPVTGEGQPAVTLPNGGEGDSSPLGPSWPDRIAAALPWLVIAWLIGVFGLSIRLAIGWHGIHRLRRAASLTADGPWRSVLSRLCERLHIRSTVRLLESSLVDVPTMIGWLRPVILWPPALLAGLSVEQFEALLAHELAHVRRHDYLVNLVQTAIETLLFYHPAVWWLSRRIRHERECCCDDLAVATCGNRLSYARALATLEELRPPARQLALAADGGCLLARIRRILGLPAPRRIAKRHWLLGLTLSATVLMLGIAVGLVNLATGDEPANQPADPPASNNAGDANPPKPVNEHKTASGIVSVLDVQTGGVADVPYLDERLADRIQALPHVKAVLNSGLVRGYSLRTENRGLPIIVIGVPPVGSTLDQELKAGRLLESTDQRKVVVSKSLAEGLHKAVGDTILDFRTTIVGIVEFKDPNAGNIVEFSLSDLQDRFYASHQVNGFLVGIDIPNDGKSEHKSQLAELSDRIRALDEAIRVFPWPKGQPIPQALREPKLFVNPTQVNRKPNWPVGSRPIDLSGRVIDDATGKRITDYHVQWGHVRSAEGPESITWGPNDFRPGENGRTSVNGRLSMLLDWSAGERARVVAGGYEPQSILNEPPTAPGGLTISHVVRLKRGRQVSGRIVDYEGKPVAGASVFVVGALANVNITGGKASTRSGRLGWAEDASITPFKTDADGKFTVTGLGGDATYLAVSCPAFDHLVVPAPPMDGGDFVIRLPQPGKLVVHFDIAGARDSAQVLVRPAPPEAGTSGPQFQVAQAGVVYQRGAVLKRRDELVFDNLPPGDYIVERMKDFESVYGVVTAAALDRSIVKTASGQAATVDFVRPKGAAVSGQVVGLDRPELRTVTPARVLVTVERANETHNNAPNPLFDAVDLGTIFRYGDAPEGKFTTERLPPGQYRIRANLFDDSRSDLTTLDKPPLFAGETLVTVSDDGQPPPVKIELQKNDPPAKPAPPAVGLEAPMLPGPQLKLKAARRQFDLYVAKILDSDATGFLPESLGEQIKKLPHITAVSGWFALSSPYGYAIGVDSPLMMEPKIISGRRLAAGDHRKVIVGSLAAKKNNLKVGDKTKVYGTDFEIVGIFEHPTAVFNDTTIALLPDVQQLLHADHQVSEFAVSIDISQDIADAQQAQIAELCKQIEALGYDLMAKNLGNARPSLDWSHSGYSGGSAPQETPIELSCRIVDDETGELIPKFTCQIGHSTPDQVVWQGEYVEEAAPPGHLLATLNWADGDRMRIIAAGYVPETVLKERPKPGEVKEITVRMKRGPRLSGRILDDAGKPVVGASVYVVGAAQDFLVTGPHLRRAAASDSPDSPANSNPIARFTTDADGKFTATGVGWDAQYLAITCPALDLWVVRTPLQGLQHGEFEVHLPQPGKLAVRYDIAGGPNDAMVALWPLTTLYRGGGAGTFGPSPFAIARNDLEAHLKYWRVGAAKQGGGDTFGSLPPGDYVVGRIKGFKDMRHSSMAVLDATVVKVLPGKTATVDFVRPKGATVTGQVIGLDRSEVLKTIPSQVFVTVGRANERERWQPPKYDRPNPILDVVALGSLDNFGDKFGGKFTTERLPPGQYRLTAKVIDERQDGLDVVDKIPFFVGETIVTVSDEGEPPAVKIELHKYKAPLNKPAPPPPIPTALPPTENETAAADPAVSLERPKAQAIPAVRCVLLVLKAGTNEQIVNGPQDEIGEQIKQLPHVTAVTRGAFDVASPKDDLAPVIYGVWPTGIAKKYGRSLTGDQIDRILGTVAAVKLRARFGDKFESFKAENTVLGVFEAPDHARLSPAMNEFMKRPPTISGFVVRTDIPQDNWWAHQEPIAELRNKIARLGEGIIVIRAERPNEQGAAKIAEEPGIDLGVQNLPIFPKADMELPEEFGEKIAKFPHVTSVTGLLHDPVPPSGFGPTVTVNTVDVTGMALNSPRFQELKVLAGRRLTRDDHRAVMIGEKLHRTLGDELKVYGKRVTVVGIFESKDFFLNQSIIMPLSEMQDLTERPHKVTCFLVHADIPQDGSPEHVAQLTELRKRIAELGDDVGSYSWFGNSQDGEGK